MGKERVAALTAFLLICSCVSAPKEPPFTVDHRSTRREAGTINVYLKNPLSLSGRLREVGVNVYYYPREDAVCLRFKSPQYTDCRQFWNKNGRDAFISAFTSYKEEYEQRRLTANKNKTTRKSYGTVRGYYVWQRAKFTVQASGSPMIHIGYQFNGDSVFFTTTQTEARYQDPMTDKRNQTSVPTAMFFTRAQAESLIELFNQEYLRSLSADTGGLDSYFEF